MKTIAVYGRARPPVLLLFRSQKSVAVGFDPNFVDTTPWNSETPSSTGEAVNVVRFVESLDGESATEIEDYTNKTAWRTALWKG